MPTLSYDEPALPAPQSTVLGAAGRGALATFVLRGASALLALAATLVLARALGASGYGTYAWAIAWTSALAVPAALGADQLAVREVARAVGRGDWTAAAMLNRRVRGLVATASLGAGALLVAGSVPVLVAGDSGGLGWALIVAAPLVPLTALLVVQQGSLQALGRFAAALAPVTVVRQGCFLLLIAVVWAGTGELSAHGALGLNVLAAAAALALGARFVRAALPDGSGRPRPRGPWRELTGSALRIGTATSLVAISGQIGVIALGVLSSESDAGAYAAAVALTVGFTLLHQAARAPLAPALARLHDAGSREELVGVLATATRWVAGLTMAGAALVGLLAEPLLAIFGEDFEEAAPALRILCAVHVVNALVAYNGLVLTMSGEERPVSRAAAAGLLATVVLSAALIPTLGVSGAALAAGGGIVLRNGLNTVHAWRLLGIDPSALALGRTAR